MGYGRGKFVERTEFVVGGMLLRIQNAEADAACASVDRRPAVYGLLRADAFQFAAGDAESGQRNEDVLFPAANGLLEVFPFPVQFVLVLHRNRRGGVFEIYRFDLFTQRARCVRESFY